MRMTPWRRQARAGGAVVAALSLLASPVTSPVSAQAPTKSAAAKPAVAPLDGGCVRRSSERDHAILKKAARSGQVEVVMEADR
jgi:hypothetical protein